MGSKFHAEVTQLHLQSKQLADHQKKLDALYNEVKAVRSSLRHELSAVDAIGAALDRAGSRMRQESGQIGAMSAALGRSADLYQRTEARIIGQKNDGDAERSAGQRQEDFQAAMRSAEQWEENFRAAMLSVGQWLTASRIAGRLVDQWQDDFLVFMQSEEFGQLQPEDAGQLQAENFGAIQGEVSEATFSFSLFSHKDDQDLPPLQPDENGFLIPQDADCIYHPTERQWGFESLGSSEPMKEFEMFVSWITPSIDELRGYAAIGLPVPDGIVSFFDTICGLVGTFGNASTPDGIAARATRGMTDYLGEETKGVFKDGILDLLKEVFQ